MTPPRYDEVFFAGLAWLNDLASGDDSDFVVLPLCEHQEAAAKANPEASLIDCGCREVTR